MKTVIKQILQVIRFVSACVALIMGFMAGIDCYLGATTYEWLTSLLGVNISIDILLIVSSISLALVVCTSLILEKLDKKAPV